ncbi:unnamed protein product [Linum tenue]|uniref:Transcriptional coactivator Hfi1/Transcriptional adapter 1 n=1 Tax=Linum tenue TaxID=586396 RepID=A0AAV0GVN6_9ROSI|nr:unnamed protein product [Linum tenue]
MQPQQSSRIDLVELKTQIVKKIGAERSKKYFFNLNRFLSQRLSKSDFDKSCFRLLGRENLPLHNQLIRGILKNACLAKTPPPPTYDVGPTKSAAIQTAKSSPGREDSHEQSGSLLPNQSQNVSIWSNGVLPVSPRKSRSGTTHRKFRDRPSPLGPNGKVECLPQQSLGVEDGGSNKIVMENGDFSPCDYQRPLHHLQVVAEQPGNEREALIQRSTEKPMTHSKVRRTTLVDEGEEVEQANYLTFSRNHVHAPLGLPFCLASSVSGGARKAPVLTCSDDEFGICYNSGVLSDTEMLRKRMEQIAVSQGLGGVSMECANMLNNMLDVYLKRLIKSCVEFVGARAPQDQRKQQAGLKQQFLPGKVINGVWPSSNHLHMQNGSGSLEVMQEQQRPRCSISLLDFKVAMELNPQQLGEDWPLLLERICMQSYED